ncbi:MAG TPA: extracellular solute-binding protein [Thermomicrobiales bacterium]
MRDRKTLSRRALVRRIVAAGAGTALLAGPTGRRTAARQLEGKIAVGYEDPLGILQPQIEAAVAAVTAEHPNAEIELRKAPGGNFATQLLLALGTNRAPDVFLFTSLGIGELAEAGFLAPLDPYLSGWEGWAQYPDQVKYALTYQGQVWALPYGLDTHFLYYRKDLFEQAGLPREWQPATPDDILAAALQIKERVPDVVPYALYAGANGGNGTAIRGLLPLLYAFGGAMQDEQGKWIIDSCPLRRTLQFYERAYRVDGTVPQQAMTAANPVATMRELMGKGDLGILYEGSWAYSLWEASDPETTHEQIGYVLFPAADGRPPFTIGGPGDAWYVNARSGNPDLAWAFIAAMNTLEAQVALNAEDLHVPARQDAAADPAFQETPFRQAVIESVAAMQIAPPDPAYRQLVGIVQNGTGLVATGDAAAGEAVERYAEELTRVLGEGNVVRQACAE